MKSLMTPARLFPNTSLILGEDDISSPIHRTEANFYGDDSKIATDLKTKSVPPKSPGSGLRKLAHLAEAINQWEDDIHSVSISLSIHYK